MARTNIDFYLYDYKTKKCNTHTAVDAGVQRYCPKYHHPFERRRNPLKHDYSWIFCPAVNPTSQSKMSAFIDSSYCPEGDKCDKSHTIFENWYHPHIYLTTLCYRGDSCRAGKLCSYAHNKKELRISALAVLHHFERSKRYLADKNSNKKNQMRKPKQIINSKDKIGPEKQSQKDKFTADDLKKKNNILWEKFERRKQYERDLSTVTEIQKKREEKSCLKGQKEKKKIDEKKEERNEERSNKIKAIKGKNGRIVLKMCNDALLKNVKRLRNLCEEAKEENGEEMEKVELEAEKLREEIKVGVRDLLRFAVAFLNGCCKRLRDLKGDHGESEIKRVNDSVRIGKVISGVVYGVEADLSIFKERILFYSERNRVRSKKISCLACRKRRMTKCLAPCGHVLCDVCEMKLMRKKCPFCGEKIKFFRKVNFE